MNSNNGKKTRPSSSAEFRQTEDGTLRLDLRVPDSWQALDASALAVVLHCLAEFPPQEAALRALMYFAGLTVLRHATMRDGTTRWLVSSKDGHGWVSTAALTSATAALSWMLEPADPPVRPEYLAGDKIRAVDSQLHGVPFGHYLQLEALFQGHLARMSMDAETFPTAPLRAMAPLLYPGSTADQPTKAECLGVFLWYASVKKMFSNIFPHLFRPPSGSDTVHTATPESLRRQTDLQIRALTDGDITREPAILAADTWRALTELDAKARESEDLRRHQQQQSRK